jgi:hypothetical protein
MLLGAPFGIRRYAAGRCRITALTSSRGERQVIVVQAVEEWPVSGREDVMRHRGRCEIERARHNADGQAGRTHGSWGTHARCEGNAVCGIVRARRACAGAMGQAKPSTESTGPMLSPPCR